MRKATTSERSKIDGVALLLVDTINAFDFPGSAALAKAGNKAARAIEALADRARAEGVPVIYVNDNFGRWRSNFNETVRECCKPKYRGSAVSERLRPTKGDYFVLKPQHSAFYSTPLDLLLEHLGAHTVVITGFAADICLAFTANDAHMRGYQIVVPSDCTAANSPILTRAALRHVREALGGRTPAARAVSFSGLARGQKKPRGQAF